MASTIKIKRSSVAAKRPTTSDISTGELALNTKDQKLFSSNGTSVFELASALSLANTNAYIAAQASRITLVNTNLTGTNTAIRALDAQKLSVANATILLAAKSTWTALTGTNTALRTLISDRLQVANAAATYQTKSVERAALANTNSRINLINTNLTGTNTAIRALDAAKLSVANAVAIYQTKAIERAALANTNASIATQTSRITLVNTNLLATNTAIRALDNAKLSVANAATLYATKSNPTTSGLLAHTGRATISTNLVVSGNTTLSGTLVANNTSGVSGYYLRTSATGVYWSPASSSGANATVTRVKVSDLNVNSFVVTSVTGAFTNPNNLISFTTATVKNLTQNDVVVTGVQTLAATNYLQIANAVSTYATKSNPTTSGLLAHTGRMTISTNLAVTGNTAVTGNVTDSIGNVRDIVNNGQSGAYVLVASDNGKMINITTGGVTVNISVFSAGNNITIYNNSASSQTITQGTSVTMYLAGTATTGNRTLAQRGICTIVCVSAGVFVISGAGLT